MSDALTAPQVKICGLTRTEDARAAAAAGAAYVGAVYVPGTPRHVEAPEARAIGRAAGLPLVLVVAGGEPEDVVRTAREAGASIVQLHGGEDPETVRAIRSAGPWGVWVAVRVKGPSEALDRVRSLRECADGVLLDTWDAGRMGGTGHAFRWSGLREVRRLLAPHQRLVLAGGLRRENVGEALGTLRPDVVDVSSGVEEAPGVKSGKLIEAFVDAVRLAGAAAAQGGAAEG